MGKVYCKKCGAEKSQNTSRYCRRCNALRILRSRESFTKEPGFVYIIQNPAGGNVKIGFTIQPEKRLQAIQRWNRDKSLQYVAVIGVPNGEFELTMHKMFDEFRVEDEWFRPTQLLYSLIHSDDRWVIHHDLIPELLF